MIAKLFLKWQMISNGISNFLLKIVEIHRKFLGILGFFPNFPHLPIVLNKPSNRYKDNDEKLIKMWILH